MSRNKQRKFRSCRGPFLSLKQSAQFAWESTPNKINFNKNISYLAFKEANTKKHCQFQKMNWVLFHSKDLFCQSMDQQGLWNFQSLIRQSGLQQQQINRSETNSNVEKNNWNCNKTHVFLCLDQNWTEETKGHLSHLGQTMDQQGLFNLKSVVRGHGLHQWQTVYPRSSWSIQLVGKTDRQAVACAMSKKLETNWKN